MFEQVDDSVRIPYIGGARGQILEIRQRPDGTIFSRILMDETKNDFKRDTDFDQYQNARAEQQEENSFESNLASIQQAAADLVTIQEIFKEQGKLTTEQRKIYSQSLEKLGASAQKLANIQGTDDEIKLLLEEPSGDKTTKSPPKKKAPENPRFPPYNFKKTEQQKKEEDCEESQGVVEEGASTTKSPSTTKKTTTSTSSPTTTKTTKKPVVIVTSSLSATSGGNSQVQNDDGESGDEESSVAEAKPVGLAIAGIGGVASSKPSGTAVVGPGGLAVARPVATAIAGLKPGEYSQLGLPLPSKVRNVATSSSRGAASLPYRGKYGIVSFGMDDDSEAGGRILVGPEYLSEARLADKSADSNDDDDDNFNERAELDGNDRNNGRDSNENLKRPVVLEEEKDEDTRDYENPYGTAEYGKFPLFPVTQDRFSYQQNPYFLPPNSYVPIPIANQYLQRRAFNPAALRYQQAISQYPSYYGQDHYNTNPSPYSPYRVFYAPQ